MRIEINPKYKQLEAFVRKLPEDFEHSGETIYKGRNEIKLFRFENLLINVKSFKIPHFINKITYACFRQSKAKRSFRYAKKIINLGADTPEPVAFLESFKFGLFQKSYYLSIHHQSDFTIRDLIGFDFQDKYNILEQFTAYTYFKLHKNKIHHLDYSRGNILINRLENNNYAFCIVDINRMNFETMPYRKGLKNFCQIWGNRDELEVIAKKYAELRNQNKEKAVAMLLQFDFKHKEKIRRKQALKKRFRKLVH